MDTLPVGFRPTIRAPAAAVVRTQGAASGSNQVPPMQTMSIDISGQSDVNSDVEIRRIQALLEVEDNLARAARHDANQARLRLSLIHI